MMLVTDFSTVSALAPLYEAEMRTVVGAISGYCDMERVEIANAPPSMMMIAITQANTGLRMKNLSIETPLSPVFGLRYLDERIPVWLPARLSAGSVSRRPIRLHRRSILQEHPQLRPHSP